MKGADIDPEPKSPAVPLILVVEDEPLVRMVTSEILMDAGFRVLQAAHAEQALAILDQTPVALVFTDVDMPGALDGLGLRGVLSQRAPDLPVVLTSGGAGRVGQDGPFIAKPYSADALVAMISAFLAPRSAGED
jgi:CheY-like chemotaxis protein